MLKLFVFVQLVNSVGGVVLSVTLYPIIPLASSVAVILTLFVVGVATVTTGFVLSIFVTSVSTYPFA